MNTRAGKVFDKRFAILIGTQVIIGIVLAILISTRKGNGGGLASDEKKILKEVGTRLQSVGILSEAAKAYEKYLENAELDNLSKARLVFNIADLYEKEGKYEQALNWYYQAEIYDPARKEKLESGQRIVAILERLKKFSAAKFALSESTSIEGEGAASKKGGTVIAKIGSREIYLHEAMETLDELPPAFREKFKNPTEKKEFVKKYVADLLLYEKAKKLQFDQSPEIRQQLDKIKIQLMVQKVFQEEIISKIKIEDSDVKNFFEAHRDNYSEKGHAEISLIKVKTKEKSMEVNKKLKAGTPFQALVKQYSEDQQTKAHGGEWREGIEEDTPFLSDNHDSLKANKMIFATDVGKWTGPLLSQGAYYIFLVRKKEKAKERPYAEIKPQVEQDYRRSKEGEHYQNLMQETLKHEDLTFYLDRVK